MAAEFEKHVELELVAMLECAHCDAQLAIDQDIDALNAVDTVKDSAQKLGVQAELEHWEMSDLDGKLDGICPVCDDCMRFHKEGIPN